MSLLIEIGCEEIPAGFLARAIAEAPGIAREKLAAARLSHGEIVALGAPRRLAIFVADLAERQPDISETVTGPPTSTAYDTEGKPTKAAMGFAAKNGVPVEALTVVEVPGKKGAYIAARREQKGEAARDLLPRLVAEILRAVPWKKSMRWALLDEAFVRPVHWLVALFGGEVVPIEIYGVRSGRETRGHRFLAPGAVALDGTLDDYKRKLHAAFVIVDPAVRRTTVEAELRRVEKDAGVKIRPDEDLVAEVTNLVEYPHAIAGNFDPRHLETPAEVIVSAMRGHQRYFATESAGGLAPHFVTIAGTLVKDPKVVQHGNERVLAARLADARFFFGEDRAHKLEARTPRLAGIAFIKGLGTMADKIARIADAARLFPMVDAVQFARAASLCKADLLTKVVGEFPELQGVMGRQYARLDGEDPAVAEAILEHYLPRGAKDALPAGDLGAALGIADRLDTIVGCFGLGLAPTGSNDPYGLRRAALAVLNILIDRGWRLPLGATVTAVSNRIGRGGDLGAVLEFLRTRLRGLLVEGASARAPSPLVGQPSGSWPTSLPDSRGLPVDCVDAALAAGFDDVPDAAARATAVAHLRERPDFEPLGVAFKRVANILKGEAAAGAPDDGLFTDASEKALWATFAGVRDVVAGHVSARDYDAALRELASIKPAVDKFFDDVLVMDPDPKVRANRLNLLGTINATFMKIADFRQLAVK